MKSPTMPIRLAAAVLLIALAAVACGDESAADTTTTTAADTTTTSLLGAPTGAVFMLTEADNGARFTLSVGDEIIVQLAPGGSRDPDWMVAVEPDLRVLAGGDGYEFVPSDPGRVAGYWETSFVAAGPGLTSVTLSRGPLNEDADSVYFTVEVV